LAIFRHFYSLSAPCFGLNAQITERTGILTQGDSRLTSSQAVRAWQKLYLFWTSPKFLFYHIILNFQLQISFISQIKL